MEFVPGAQQRLAFAHPAQGECGSREPGFVRAVDMQQAGEVAHRQIGTIVVLHGCRFPVYGAEFEYIIMRHWGGHVLLRYLGWSVCIYWPRAAPSGRAVQRWTISWMRGKSEDLSRKYSAPASMQARRCWSVA